MTLAYKFLAVGAIGPISGFVWPAPGEWVEVEGALRPGRHGAHVCGAEQLAHWMHDELWECEIAGEMVEALDCVVVRRARLVRRVEAWSTEAAARFAEACIAHGEAQLVGGELADAREALEWGYPAIAAFHAAVAVARAAPDAERAYARERAWQGRWIAEFVIESDRV